MNPLLANQALRRPALALGVLHRTGERVAAIERLGAGSRTVTSRGVWFGPAGS